MISLLRKIKNYILENEFKLTYLNDKVDIINYLEIDHFDDNMIIVRYDKGTVTIKGYKMIISKLMDDELLINGKIEKIDIR